jgi:VRR-NUC domain
MAQAEAKLSRKIMDALRARGAFVWKNHGNSHMMAGLPDIAGCYRGHFIGVETKMPGGRVSPRQEFVHEQINAAEGKVIVAYSIPQALSLLTEIDSLIDG